MIIDSNELNGLNNQISIIMEAGKSKERVQRVISEVMPPKDAGMLKIEEDIRGAIEKMIALRTG
jgi:hypothetical protein